MVSQADDGSQRVALLVVCGVVVLVTALATGFGIRRALVKVPGIAAPAALVVVPVSTEALTTSEFASLDTAQAASDDASIAVEQNVVKFYFASGKADLATGASDAMAELVKAAQAGRKLAITGFHDATGSAVQNAGLARQRALAVREALTAAGVASGQIQIRKPEPVSVGGSDAQARRVEINLL